MQVRDKKQMSSVYADFSAMETKTSSFDVLELEEK